MRRSYVPVLRWLDGKPRDLLAAPSNPAKVARSRVGHFVHDQIWRAYEEVLAYEATPRPSPEVIHKFRSANRRLRYCLELFSGALAHSKTLVEPLHTLQDRLGDLHDHVVAVELVRGWLSESRLPSTGAIRAYLAERIYARDQLCAEFPAERSAVEGSAFRLALVAALCEGRRVASAPARLHLVPAA